MNKITATGREKILARARSLQRAGVSYAAAVSQLQSEFGISRDRARSAVGKALRTSRRRTR